MAHIPVPEGLPGIFGLITAYPEPAKHLAGLAQALLRGPSPLTAAEREMIAAFVSSQNECSFCLNSHAAAARCLLGGERQVADQVLSDYQTARVSEQLKALLAIADKVRQDGRLVTAEDVARARAAGADDQAIHDTVLIAAAFCMFNRYVDGLGTWAPDGQVMTYPDAALVMMKLPLRPYTWPEKLTIAGICLAVWLLITRPDLRWLWGRLNRKRL
jgi:uncharacterized peroxidase-related enzyme